MILPLFMVRIWGCTFVIWLDMVILECMLVILDDVAAKAEVDARVATIPKSAVNFEKAFMKTMSLSYSILTGIVPEFVCLITRALKKHVKFRRRVNHAQIYFLKDRHFHKAFHH